MYAMSSRILPILFIIVFLCPSSLSASPEQRTALVIGNSAYKSAPLKNPVNDATDLAANLKKLGFVVTLKKNAGHQEMEDAIREFGDQLRKGGVGLFFYAGHGVQIGGRNYLLPIGTKINKETDVKFQAVDAEMVLSEMGNAGNNLNIVILDACRDNPFGKSFRSASRGLAIISDAPKGTFITYSTSPGKVAADGSGRNSPYTESMIQHMNKAGLQIEDVFKEVRKDIGRKTKGLQVPWELSSLEGKFYFNPGKATTAAVTDESPASTTSAVTDALDEENRKLEAERQRLEQEKADLERQKALTEKRRQIEEEKKRLAVEREKAEEVAMAKVPQQEEVKRDPRFVDNSNGTITDKNTGLMWAAKDNGSDVNWANAKRYCENYSGGGYSDWRMPTQDELAKLYDPSKIRKSDCGYDVRLTELIRITCAWVWASETRYIALENQASGFYFYYGSRNWARQSVSNGRALPVRSVK